MITSLSLTLLLKISLLWGFLFIAAFIMLVASGSKSHISIALRHVRIYKSIYIVVILLGMNVALWMSSGLLATIIYHGLDFISPKFFLVLAFLFSALVAFIMGTGLGTFSTIGMVFLSLSIPMGINKPMVVGAIVSGAFIADKLSFASALTQININVTNSNYKKYFLSSMKTLMPAILITSIIYFIITPDISNLDSSVLFLEKQGLENVFIINNFLLLLPILFLILSFLGVGSTISLSIMIVLNSLAVVFIQGDSLKELFGYLFFGYDNPATTLFHGGGILPMIEVVLIVMAAIYVTGMITVLGLLEPLLKATVEDSDTPIKLVFKTSILSIFLTAITCDQTVGIIMPGDYLKSHYKKMNLPDTLLPRTISDSGIITAPLQFWNVNALIIFGLTGVSALQYAPYAIFCYLMPLMTWAVTAYTYRNHKS